MLATVLSECRVDVTAVGGAGELAAVLAQRGVALFDGVRSEQQLLQLTARLGRIVPHRDSVPSGITVLADHGETRPRPGQAGFSRQPLAPHTDCSDRSRPPLLVMAVCVRPAERGGEYILVDGQAVHGELAAIAPDALADFSMRRGAYYGGSAGIVGNVFEPGPGHLVGMRLRRDELARFAPHTQRWLPVLGQVIDRHAVSIPAVTGCGYVINNWRWLHGRVGFTGHRTVCRVHLDPHPGWRIPAAFIDSRAAP
ncbi:TauD/TfdA family dioxygenase [Amycolatopsis sp. NPDC026612]|uniref:TauD/TfdA family dioxygenase n=1 Tax=Amycolatopsis sp. NPDC026612 TaxID=3155466 RepID=UPI0033FF7D31